MFILLADVCFYEFLCGRAVFCTVPRANIRTLHMRLHFLGVIFCVDFRRRKKQHAHTTLVLWCSSVRNVGGVDIFVHQHGGGRSVAVNEMSNESCLYFLVKNLVVLWDNNNNNDVCIFNAFKG